MRTLAFVALAAACGKSPPAREDAAIDAGGLPPCANPVAGANVTMRPIAKVAGAAVLVTSPPGDPRLFVVEQHGAIRIIEDGQLRPAPFLDLSAGPVSDTMGDETGLLGLAFDPD